MRINTERLWARTHELAKIGQDKQGGLTRLAFTEEERQAKTLIKTYMNEAGLIIREDQIGNVFGTLPGTDPDSKTILIGSHLDTVFNGGMFDGAAGVMSGIELLQTLSEHDVKLGDSVEVVAFTDEEGARFSSGMLGSQAYIGQLATETLEKSLDSSGISIAQAMREQGYQPEKIEHVKSDIDALKCYLEVHIEQGKVLEGRDVPVGLVTGIVGLRWLRIRLRGEAGHAGTTPMSPRKDPLACASELIQYVEALANEQTNSVATVGQMYIKPNGVNVIPSEVEFTIDLRDLSDQLLDQLVEKIKDQVEKVAGRRGIQVDIDLIDRSEGVNTSELVNQAIESAIKQNQIECVKLPSGAGHDAMIIAQVTKIGMVFLRTKNGISHTPEEWVDQADLAAGVQVLLDTVIALSN